MSFRCVICLDLLFKPVVQSCGHAFCFWCAHRAMNRTRQSQCPLCRRRYIHFPQVCQLLHFFLMKAKPGEYNRRAQEIQDVEESNNVFSTRIVESPQSAGSPCECSELRQSLSPRLDPLSPVEQAHLYRGQLLDLPSADTHPAEYNNGNNELPVREDESGFSPIGSKEDFRLHGKALDSGTTGICNFQDGKEDDFGYSISLTVEDFQCASCKNFLYRPVVLNCGQVFCESCICNHGKAVSCPSCEGPQPVTLVQVCLELHHYLERAFPVEYSKRKEDVFSQRDTGMESEIAETRSRATQVDVDPTVHDGGGGRFVHAGSGCDRCGMFPIVGDRYHCLDCPEKIGYDLCGSCYRKGAGSFTGRFNQQHRADHCMEKGRSTLRETAVTLDLHMENGSIQRRRQQQHMLDELDAYINGFM